MTVRIINIFNGKMETYKNILGCIYKSLRENLDHP